MFNKIFLLVFLFILFQLKAFSAVFVVTSNADSGPGTLRDALTKAAANGSAEKDYINFNIADLSEAGRAITISSKLPNISSNLVIDATTQPGAVFGVSNTKIILQPDAASNNFNALTFVDVDGFELYGLYVRDFIGTFTYFLFGIKENNLASALYVETSKNIQIGAPGKGNVFSNNEYVLKIAWASSKTQLPYPVGIENFKFYANFVGVEPDGKTYRQNKLAKYGLDITECKGDIEIGGDDVSQRNIFCNCESYISQAGNGPATAFTSSINIKNNYFNYDVDGWPVDDLYKGNSTFMFIFTCDPNYDYYGYPYTYNIINNKIQYPAKIYMNQVGGDITYQGNQELLGKQATTVGENRIYLTTGGRILVGGELPGQGNMIYGCQLDLYSPKSMILDHTAIYCAPTEQWNDGPDVWVTSGSFFSLMPVINITAINALGISGTATPLSKVELYWDDDCNQCEPQTYFATVQTDSKGLWNYSGTVKTGVIASATLNNFTSLYTSAAYINNYSIKHSSCGQNNGSLTGFAFTNGGGYEILNDKNVVISTNADAKNLAPGHYMVRTLNGGSCQYKATFTILDATPKIKTDRIKISQPSCGNNSGSITNISLDNDDVTSTDPDAYTKQWVNANNEQVGSGLNLNNVGAGTYTLKVSYKGQCVVTYGPVTLNNTTGPNINQSQQIIQSTNCGQSTGTITNIKISGGTGNYQYTWLDAQKKTVGTDLNLTGQPAGVYTLAITDGGSCGPIYSTDITIPETNGITLAESKANTSAATCGLSNGSVTGITVTGATQYTWTDANSKTYIATTPDLINAPAGTYTLTASNTTGCSKTSNPYTIIQPPPTQYPAFNYTSYGTCQNASTGSIIIAITTDNLIKSLRWVNSAGQNVGYDSEVDNLPAGIYQLYFTDYGGCETLYNSYNITAVPPLTIVSGSEQEQDDHCSANTGNIKGVKVEGGLAPYTYSWTNAAGTVVSQTADLNNAGAGAYTLKVTDASSCGFATGNYALQNQDNAVPAPIVNDVQLCSPGAAQLQVKNPAANYSYRLYGSNTATTPIDEQPGGVFKITANAASNFYVSQFFGNCESSRTKVNITIGIAGIDIANTFTPNGDGINDYWQIKNISNYPDAFIQIFNRYGQKVFESRGYSTPFNGTYKGQELAAGVYYYIINLGIKCNLLSGSLTIIR